MPNVNRAVTIKHAGTGRTMTLNELADFVATAMASVPGAGQCIPKVHIRLGGGIQHITIEVPA